MKSKKISLILKGIFITCSCLLLASEVWAACQSESCNQPRPTPVCGNSLCETASGENTQTCYTDCPAPGCGDHVCSSSLGETMASCAVDCGMPTIICGDGIISAGENCHNCPADVPYCDNPTTVPTPFCCNQNGVCEPGRGETAQNCPGDCCPTCGNGVCNCPEENQTNCPIDCACSAPGRVKVDGSTEADGCCPVGMTNVLPATGECSSCVAVGRHPVTGATTVDGCCNDGFDYFVDGRCSRVPCPTGQTLQGGVCVPVSTTTTTTVPTYNSCSALQLGIVYGRPAGYNPQYSVDKVIIRDADSRTNDSCLENFINEGIDYCRDAVLSHFGDGRKIFYKPSSGGMSPHNIRERGVAVCLVRGWLNRWEGMSTVRDSSGLPSGQYVGYIPDLGYLRPELLFPEESIKIDQTKADCVSINGATSYCQSGNIYFDSSCNQINRPMTGEICNAGTVNWSLQSSPISLLFEGNKRLEEKDSTVVNFSLDPKYGNNGYSVWKASKKAPLLVYDPEHNGRITSAHQLFGNWTFGGKRLASLFNSIKESAELQKESSWKDGFEALGTLDSNFDQKISDAELEPLALWFDENRNGVSEVGEVRNVKDVGIKELYYSRKDSHNIGNDIYLEIGYQREVNGQLVSGVSVDWFSQVSDSEVGLLNKQLIVNSLFENPDVLKKDILKVDKPEEAKPAAKLESKLKDLSGVWRWKVIDGSSVKSSGIFAFEDNGESLSGVTLTEAVISPPLGGQASRIAKMLPIRGIKSAAPGKDIVLEFSAFDENGEIVKNKAIYKVSDNSISGESTVSARYKNSADQLITYQWKAVPFIK